MKIRMDLAEEFKKILQEYGTDVLVLRQEKRLRCSCYNEVTQEVSRTCPICLGLGYSFVAEKHTVRSEGAVAATQMLNVLKTGEIGSVLTGDLKFFTLPNLTASERDLIIFVDWDQHGRPVYKNRGIWKITNIDNTQDLGSSQQIYKVYYASITPVHSKIRGIRLSELNGIKQYNILMEG